MELTPPGAAPPPVPRRPRFLVVHLPSFRLERCGYGDDDVAALVAEQKGALRVVALTSGARALGLREGTSLTEARARVPDVQIEDWDPDGEASDRQALVDAYRALSDQVAPLWHDHLVLEVSGTTRLFGGEAALLARARDLAASLGHACRCALADDPLAAAGLAGTRTDDPIHPPGQAVDLPIAALRPSAPLLEALRALGIERLRELGRLDAAAFAGRFGEEGARLHRIARGGRGAPELFASPESERFALSATLGGPTVTLEPIRFVLQGLLAQLASLLEARDRMAVRLVVRLDLDGDLPPRTLRVRVGRPTRSPAVLARVLGARLEGLRLDAPVTAVALEVEEHVRHVDPQPGLTDRAEATEPLPDLLARLTDTLGDEAVFTPRLVDSWRPEATWRPGPFPGLPSAPDRRATQGRSVRPDPVEIQGDREADLPRPRPTLLLERPRPVAVRIADGRPVSVGLDEGWVALPRAVGPERLQGEWWSEAGAFDRDYWVVDTPDGTAWIFTEDGRWFLHGWFD